MSSNARISGMIVGAAAGDCLGTPYVFMRSERLIGQAAKICWEISAPGVCLQMLRHGIGAVSRYGLNFDALVRAYGRWVASGPELDCVTALCFDGKRRNAESMRRMVPGLDHGALCSNLLLIRQIPVVLAGIGRDRESLFRLVDSECRLTHDDAESVEYAQLYAYCLQCALRGMSRLEIWDRMFEAVRLSKVRATLLNSYYEKPRCDDADYSHAGVAFAVSMYHFWHDRPFASCMRSVVLSGGATDVNAAAAGALLGASQGLLAIPRGWRDTMFEEGFGTKPLMRKAIALGGRETERDDKGFRPARRARTAQRRGRAAVAPQTATGACSQNYDNA